MGFWEIFALVLTGSGTLSSILGIFFAIYAKQNGKVTREFIAEQNRSMTEFLGKILERIDEGFKRMDEGFKRMDEGFRRIDEGFRKMDERAEQRHQEVIRLIKSMDERTALISRQISEIPHKTVSLIK
jgi:glycine cleavage system pyridoxal-binding protein P